MIRRLIPLLVLLIALPVLAQTTTTTTTKTTTKTSKGTTHRLTHKTTTKTSGKTAVWNDATRLAALLRDVQANVTLSENVWRTVANEANALANRIYGRTAGSSTARAAARDLRTHVREMRTAALAGDAAGARTHASEALPFATRLIEWSMPAAK